MNVPDYKASQSLILFIRNILAHGTFPEAPYFLMVFPDKFYLWTDAEANLDRSEPTYTIDARSILEPYFKQAGVKADHISRQSLELIILSWLGQIIYSDKLPENIEASQRWLIDSGLYAALAGGKFTAVRSETSHDMPVFCVKIIRINKLCGLRNIYDTNS